MDENVIINRVELLGSVGAPPRFGYSFMYSLA